MRAAWLLRSMADTGAWLWLLQLQVRTLVFLIYYITENPLLEQVKARLLALPAGAPLPQLLTGLELLLTSCHEWQKKAHRGMSLQAQKDQLTQLILRWRKRRAWTVDMLSSVGTRGQASRHDRPK